MPEVWFNVRWPDESRSRCYSPSSTVTDYFDPGRSYSVDEFTQRSREALNHASERVRARYGVACGNAAAQLDAIERRAAGYAGDARVTVEGFER